MERDKPPRDSAILVGPLMETGLDALGNRNAVLDRQRARKHVVPDWAKVSMENAQQLPA